MMIKLKSRPELLEALNRASTKQLSAKELHDQRVSFAMNSVSSDKITRERVAEVVSKQEGRIAS